MKHIYETLKQTGIIPVVKINNAKDAVALANALKNGGLPAAEITFRTEAAAEAIRKIAINVPEVCVCAGTVLTLENAKRAVDAGAKALISPGTNPDIVHWCIVNDITIIPGCATPSEADALIQMGLDVVKLFPAEAVGGIAMLKSLYGPYPNLKFMPTGGISEKNVMEYLALPNVICCGGSWMVPESAIDTGDFVTIETLTRNAAKCIGK